MQNDFYGIILRIGATFFFTLMVIFIKILAEDYPVGQTVFFRSAFAMIPLVMMLVIMGDFPSGLKTKRPGGHILRCLLGCVAMFASFASLKYLPLSHASILGYLAPILAILLARALLKENVTFTRWIGVLTGFSGVVVLILPNINLVTIDHLYMLGVGLALAMAIFTAGAKIQIRSLALSENAGAIAFYFALTCAIAGLITLPFGWVIPNSVDLLYLIGSGIAGGIAHIMMTLGYKYSDVSKLAAFEYLSLFFAVIADLVIFNIIPSYAFYPSAALILIGSIIAAFKDDKFRLMRVKFRAN
ncbi:DMT family transporter [Curvivirga sp.]|uniref:DMT family transporter n=1 Tax=Curvivirga sp. TaxID=2856848 RepID=UPI003B5ABF21